jgi:glycosyltransferase involved in cell wall biosynthesis
MQEYTVSVLMSLYQSEKPQYLEEALSSLLHQTVQADEVVIVCEGNLPEEHYAILRKYKSLLGEKVLKIVATNSKGLTACLNEGLKHASFDWIARFDTDDVCLPERIQKQKEFLKANPDVVIASAPLLEYNESMTVFTGVRRVPLSDEDIRSSGKWQCPFNHPSTIYRRDVALSLGGYPLLSANEDYAFFCNFLVHGYKSQNYDQPLVKARTGNALISRRRGLKYLKGEMECMSFLKKIGFLKWHHYFIHMIVKSIVRSLPTSFVKIIYKGIRTTS